MEENCVFCKIAKNELPCYKLYEDDNFLAILDIFPVKKGHALVIPKKHFRWVHDVEPFGEYWEVALKVARAQEKALQPKWVQYGTHGLVPHAHIHVIPRYTDIEKAKAFVFEKIEPNFTQDEFAEFAEKIKSGF